MTWPHILKKTLSSTTYLPSLINVVCERPLVQKWYNNTFFFKFQVTGPIIVKRMNTSNGTVYYQQPAAASNSSAASANCRDPSRNPASSDSISSKNFKVSKGGIQNDTALVGAECFATSKYEAFKFVYMQSYCFEYLFHQDTFTRLCK